MQEFKLKPCPFCGGEGKPRREHHCHGHGDYSFRYAVICVDCGAFGPIYDDRDDWRAFEKAISGWERRVEEDK